MRLKRDTTNSVLPSWLENIVRNTGKRSKDEILLFIKNIGIQFIRKRKDGGNSKTENPSAGNNSQKPKITTIKSPYQFNSMNSTKINRIETVTTQTSNIGSKEKPPFANKTEVTTENQKLSDYLTAQRENISESATNREQLIASKADTDKIVKRIHMSGTSVAKDSDGSKHMVKSIQKENLMETLQTSTSVTIKDIQGSKATLTTTPAISSSSMSHKMQPKDFGRKIKSVFIR